MKNKTHLWLPILLLAAAILWMACGDDAKASTMLLTRTEGTVGVLDETGQTVSLAGNLGLYSGYQVDTQTLSYAWITLDQAKLAKLDEDTQVEIQKDEKQLEIALLSGSLFFHVTEPLADDETMDIRTSATVTGIRGTCGWVESLPGSCVTAVLEGSVECTAPGIGSVMVSAGMMAVLADGDTSFDVRPITSGDIPFFVSEEAPEDLLNMIADSTPDEVTPPSAGDAGQPGTQEPSPAFGLELPPVPDDGIERTVLTVENNEQLHELLASGGLSNTEIRLTGDTYYGEHLTTDELGNTYTAQSFMLNRCETLSLVGDGSTRLVVSHEDALILSAYGCDNLLLYGLVLGHDVPPDVPCSEPVLSLSDCSGVRIVGCDLFGSGLIGITGSETTLAMQDSAIRDCSERAVLWSGGGSASFERCSFSGNGGPLFYIFIGGADFTLTDCTMQNNSAIQKRAYFDESTAGSWNESGTTEIGNGWQ